MLRPGLEGVVEEQSLRRQYCRDECTYHCSRQLQVEDWHGEKCDVSLLEGINAEIIVNLLDAACDWLRQSDLSDAHTEALCDRLLLRKVGITATWY